VQLRITDMMWSRSTT